MTHLPVRPTWRCSTCDGDWPCANACDDLRAEYDGVLPSLAMYLGRCFVEAVGDLPDQSTGELHTRFFGWLRPSRRGAAR